MLSCAGLTKRFGKRVVLSNCTLSVAPGSCAVIRGPSGGGKSTLIRILALLEPADTGTVRHADKVYNFPMRGSALRFPVPVFPFLTLVFQQLYLWPNMSIRENVALVVEGERQARLRQGALNILKRFDVEDVLDLKPHECSLGQRQRVAVARAILTPTQYILLDEPTSALDRRNRATTISALLEAKRGGRGLLIVSHDERGLEEIADSNFELENGTLNPSRSG